MITYRPVHQALENADRIREELPFLIQPSQSNFDMVTLAAEVRRLRNILSSISYEKTEDPHL